MRNLDMYKIILRNADLRRADLRGASLERAIIAGADFRGADLTDADLSVYLGEGAKFHQSKLVNFKFADEFESDNFADLLRASNILDLARADGLDEATAKSQTFVQSYIERAFHWAIESSKLEQEPDWWSIDSIKEMGVGLKLINVPVCRGKQQR
jgi:hypothetical protein